jgi:C1A family cysteine protease
MPRKVARYGWVRDLPDFRDRRYAAPRVEALPAAVDLRAKCPPVYDQGELGSCTANAIAGALEFLYAPEGIADFTPSRLFIYYNERVMEGDPGQDAGAQIRDGIKCVAQQGVCREDPTWPYDAARFADAPPSDAYAEAKSHLAIAYQSLSGLAELRGCLAEGFPVVFGFTVYESFESQAVAQSGVMPLPGPDEQVVGGHAVLAVGYDDAAETLWVRNSWGPGWGQAGYFAMPYGVVTGGMASDYWTIRKDA